MAAKPPGGGGPIPPRAPTAARAPTAPRVPSMPGVPAAPRVAQVPIAPPTPKVSVEEAAAAAAGMRPRPPSTPDDWEATDVTRPHDMMLSRDDVRTLIRESVDQAIAAPFSSLRSVQDDVRARLGRIEERLSMLERSQLTPVAPPVRSPPPLPVAVPVAVAAPVAVAVTAPAPVAVSAPAPAPVAVAAPSDPFGSVAVAAPARRPLAMEVDLSPDEILFDGAKRRRRITVVVLLLLLITVGTFVGIAMTSQMRAGH